MERAPFATGHIALHDSYPLLGGEPGGGKSCLLNVIAAGRALDPDSADTSTEPDRPPANHHIKEHP
jgi:hypothetical protein